MSSSSTDHDAYIAGVGIHEFGRFDKPFEQIGKEAVVEALDDAKMTVKDLDIGLCSNIYLPSSSGMRVMAEIGRTGIPVTDVDAACAAGVSSLSMARSLVESGSVDVALAFGVEKMPRGFMDPTNIYSDWMCHMGLSQNPQYWAMAAKRHMHDHGTTPEQLAEVSVKNHENGVRNPNAYYQEAMDKEEVMGSRMVCDPLHLYEICVPDDGAGAAIVTTEDVVNDQGITDAVNILTSTHRTAKFPSPRAGTYCVTPAGNPTATELTAEAAYADAGVIPEDISLAEVQDTNAFEEIRWYEQLGFCETGQGGAFIESGAPYPDGEMPVNVSGGLISKGEPPGASHLGQVHELVTQLRDNAGKRQVDHATVGLGHVIGGMGQCGITILGSE